jgi:mono/diheme cytochrome c family protein
MRSILFVALLASCRTLPTEPAVQQPAPAPVAQPEPPPQPQLDPTQVARGAYLAAVAGCNACHGGGGVEVTMPNGGVWRAPNITPDRETGIGNWSDTQVIAAIRRGIRPDGSRLLPVMPYPYYHKLTDADARDLVAFLRSQPPIYNKIQNSENVAMMPIDLPEPVGNVDDTTNPKAHGEYLANLAHCGACHTPTDGPMANVTFAGGVELPHDTGTILSANITPDPTTGIGGWTEDEILAAVRTGHTRSGRRIDGPMAMYVEGWAKLDDEDARALAVYVMSVQPANNDVPDRQAQPITSQR